MMENYGLPGELIETFNPNNLPNNDVRVYEESKRIKPFKKWRSINVPLWLLKRKEISQGSKLLYGRLLFYIGKDLYCYPLQKTLAKELGMSIRTVSRYINELKKNNLIEVEQKGDKKPAKYYILSHKWEGKYRKDSLDSF